MQQYPLHTTVYVLTIIILWWPLWSTRYVVDNGVLTIKSLWLSWKIPLSEIQSIQPTDHSIIAPALSLKRLRIDYTEDGRAEICIGFTQEIRLLLCYGASTE